MRNARDLGEIKYYAGTIKNSNATAPCVRDFDKWQGTGSYIHVFCVIVTSIEHRRKRDRVCSISVRTAELGLSAILTRRSCVYAITIVIDSPSYPLFSRAASVYEDLMPGGCHRECSLRSLHYFNIWQQWSLDGASHQLLNLELGRTSHTRDWTIVFGCSLLIAINFSTVELLVLL